MGWDGYACRVKFDEFYKENLLERLSDSDPVQEAFRNAASQLPNGEFYLSSGHLGTRASARALARATGEDPYNVEWWPDKVKQLAQCADWSFEVDAEDTGAKASAKILLEVCAEHNLGLRFD